MKIHWNIETGYVTRIPDWKFEIPQDEIEGLSEDELEDYVYECIQQRFLEAVRYTWTNSP
jgi:hypothetical protein